MWERVLGVLQTPGTQARLCHQRVPGCTEGFCCCSRVTILYGGTVRASAPKNEGFSTEPPLGESKHAADLNLRVSVRQKGGSSPGSSR